MSSNFRTLLFKEMAKQQVNEIIKWVEDNYPNSTLTITEVKELITIERTAEPGIYGAWAENLPQRLVDEMEKELKDSGEYYILEKKVKDFKDKIAGIYKPNANTKS